MREKIFLQAPFIEQITLQVLHRGLPPAYSIQNGQETRLQNPPQEQDLDF
jgi:hypothetical protein